MSITTITIWRRNMAASCCHPLPDCHRTWQRLISIVRAAYPSPGALRATVPPLRHDSTTTKPLRITHTPTPSIRRDIRRTPPWPVSVCSVTWLLGRCTIHCNVVPWGYEEVKAITQETIVGPLEVRARIVGNRRICKLENRSSKMIA
jgi:hypothetical protein